jgi:arylsulfatase
MNQFINLVQLFLFISFFSCGYVSADEKEKQPNIVIILADDLGYSDIGCMGGEIETPNLDALAKNGLLFTHCYNASRCAPSRASLLTGLYQHRTGIGHMVEDYGYTAYRGFLNKKCATIAEVLGETGYTTIMTGKWHVGSDEEHWPDKRGFENYFGSPRGGGYYFYPSKFIDRPLYRNGDLVTPDPETFYSTDNFTTEAIQFIEQNRTSEKPFFLYLAYISPHWPLQAWPEDIAKYDGVYDQGYKAIREKRFERQKELGIIDAKSKLSPPEYEAWDIKTAKTEARKMAVYAAMVDRMDQNIGKLV